MTGALDAKTVLITGAGAGLGRGVALAAGNAGAHVIVTSRGDNGLETATMIEDRGGIATWIKCDVTDRVEWAVAEAVRITGRLDGLWFTTPSLAQSSTTRAPRRSPSFRSSCGTTTRRWRCAEPATALRPASLTSRPAPDG